MRKFAHPKIMDLEVEEPGPGFTGLEPFPDDEPPGYRTTEATPRNSLSRTPSPIRICPSKEGSRPEGACRLGSDKAFTKQVVCNIIGFGILA